MLSTSCSNFFEESQLTSDKGNDLQNVVKASLIVPVPSLSWDGILPIKKGLVPGKNRSVREKQFKSEQSHTDEESCDMCGKAFSKNLRMKTCQLTHINDLVRSKYTCQECGKMYPLNQNLRAHTTSKHTEEVSFKWVVCEKGFVLTSNMKRYRRVHEGTALNSMPQFPYTECDKMLKRKEGLRFHIMVKHTGKIPLTCNECEKGFITETKLRRIHEPVPACPPYVESNLLDTNVLSTIRQYLYFTLHFMFLTFLAIMDKLTYFVEFMARRPGHPHLKHLLSSVEFVYEVLDMQHKCNRCAKGFCSEKTLTYHMKSKHKRLSENNPMTCKLCRHVRKVHFGSFSRTVYCKECVETFSGGQALKYHMENHTDEKHFKCTFCWKMFSKQAYLQSHLVYKHDRVSGKISKLKRRVQCTECGRKLINKKVLETHMRLLHSVGRYEKIFECNDCGKNFSQQCLQSHFLLKHAKDSDETRT